VPGVGSGPAFCRDGQLARGRALDVMSALAAAHPEQAVRLINRLASALPGEDDWLASTAAYGAALAAAPADPERAGQLAAAVRDETRRGLAWEQVGRAYLQKGDWPRALGALQTAAGVGRVSLMGAMGRRASPEQLRQLQPLATSVEERLALVEALAASQPDQAWEVARTLKADPRFFGAAASIAAALANRDPA